MISTILPLTNWSNELSNYIVIFRDTIDYEVEIEASSPDEAQQLAVDEYYYNRDNLETSITSDSWVQDMNGNVIA
jgi:hypothetical protein